MLFECLEDVFIKSCSCLWSLFWRWFLFCGAVLMVLSFLQVSFLEEASLIASIFLPLVIGFSFGATPDMDHTHVAVTRTNSVFMALAALLTAFVFRRLIVLTHSFEKYL